MKEYEVTLPVHGIVYVTVQANSESEALEIALDTYTSDDLSEWSAVESFGQGNISYVSPTEAIVELVGEIEE